MSAVNDMHNPSHCRQPYPACSGDMCTCHPPDVHCRLSLQHTSGMTNDFHRLTDMGPVGVSYN